MLLITDEPGNTGQASAPRRPSPRPDGLRVCHLGKFYPPAWGGIETHLQTLARAQAALGARVRVVVVNHRDRRGRDVTWRPLAPTPTVEEGDGPVRVTRLGRWASLARLEVCPGLPRLLARVAREGADVLHLHTPNPTMLLTLAALPHRLPLVITHHSDVVRQRLLRLAQWPAEKSVYDRAGLILATSPAYAAGSALLQRYAAKVRPLPLGIDLTPFQRPSPAALAEADRLRVTHGRPLWMCVGRLVYYKGFHAALAALAHVPGTLLVIGQGPLEADLKRQARELDIADRVIWRAEVEPDELTGAYHAAEALWFPSNARSEGFGLVQVEALASGCPVVNTAIAGSGVSWVSPDGVSGLTIPINDPAALAAAARRLLEEPGLRERLSRQARARAAEEFDHGVMAERALAAYRSVLAGRA